MWWRGRPGAAARAAGAGVLALALCGGRAGAEPGEDLGPLRRAAVERVCAAAVADMAPAHPEVTLLVFRLANDATGQVTALLRDRIAGAGCYAVAAPGLVDQVLGRLGVPQTAPATAAEALAGARGTGAQAVLLGRVERLSVEPDGATEADLKLRVLEVESGDGLFAGRYRARLESGLLSAPHLAAWLTEASRVRRGLVWVFVVLLLPFASVLARRLVDARAPGVSLVLVALYTLIDGLLALALVGFTIPDPTIGAGLAGAVACALWYNLSVGTKINGLEISARGAAGAPGRGGA